MRAQAKEKHLGREFERSVAFSQCFACGYSLSGHTGEFVCPECGVHYDERTVVWHSPYSLGGRRATLRGLSLMFGTLVFAGLGAIACVWYPERFSGVLVLLAVAAFAVKILFWRLRAGAAPYVAVTPGGVVVSHDGKPGNFLVVTWAEVREEMAKARSRFTMIDELLSDLGVLIHIDHRKEFRQALEERLAQNPADIAADA